MEVEKLELENLHLIEDHLRQGNVELGKSAC